MSKSLRSLIVQYDNLLNLIKYLITSFINDGNYVGNAWLSVRPSFLTYEPKINLSCKLPQLCMPVVGNDQSELRILDNPRKKGVGKGRVIQSEKFVR